MSTRDHAGNREEQHSQPDHGLGSNERKRREATATSSGTANQTLDCATARRNRRRASQTQLRSSTANQTKDCAATKQEWRRGGGWRWVAVGDGGGGGWWVVGGGGGASWGIRVDA